MSLNDDKLIKLVLNDEDRVYLNLLVNKSNNLDYKYINFNEFQNLQDFKNKIFDSKNWDRVKKFSNDYELIHIPNKRNKSDSIALYQPLSRSYFKMIEIIDEFNLFDFNTSSFKSAHLAEGPGGFMEAIYNTSHKYGFQYYSYYGITLFSSNRDIPGWCKAMEFIKSDNDINICYGADQTGNLYKSENIKNFYNKVGKGTCDIVTGDGGFDFSLDFNKQEILSYRLILCEIITALYVQKIGGKFICKTFDLYTLATIKLLFFLSCFYDEVNIFKPLTSRPANSEKYIIAKGFRGIDYNYLDQILEIIKFWENNEESIYVNDIFDTNIPSYFLKDIKLFNKNNSMEQIKTINKTIRLTNNKSNLSVLNKIIENQVLKAKEWCNKYNQNINYGSNFLKTKKY